MTQHIDKNFSSSSYILLGLAYLLIISSLFIPIGMLNDKNTFYPEIELIAIAKRFITDNQFTILIIPIAIYPYSFAIISTVFLSKYTIKIANTILTLTDKTNTKIPAYIKYPLYIIKNISQFLISYLPITINILIYIGFYLMPMKPFLMSLFGIIILATMLFTNFYINSQNKIQTNKCLKAIYIATNYGIQNVIYIIMIITIMKWKNVEILIGAYLALLGFIALLFGLFTILYNKNTTIYKETNKQTP